MSAIAIASLPLSRKPGGVGRGGSISFSGASGSAPNGGWCAGFSVARRDGRRRGRRAQRTTAGEGSEREVARCHDEAMLGREPAPNQAAGLAYERIGEGPPLVLIHGLGATRAIWRPQLELLAAERDVIAVDLPGFGASPT